MNKQAKVDCDNDGFMVREGLRVPVLKINRAEFTKTPEEKIRLANIKKAHNRELKLRGHSPNKRLNTSEPSKMRYWHSDTELLD